MLQKLESEVRNHIRVGTYNFRSITDLDLTTIKTAYRERVVQILINVKE